ncbi:MAG: hypothetical protein WC627_09230 [Legionella sp.]|jgi:hypothetical protein
MNLKINPATTKFFISINQQGPHTFIMAGIYEEIKTLHVLCRVGKIADTENLSLNLCLNVLSWFFNTCFFSTKAILKDEGVARKHSNATDIHYQAYEITYEHYLELVQLLESVQTTSNKFTCYKPNASYGDTVELRLTSDLILDKKPKYPALEKSANELSINNNCRHTAIYLVEQVSKTHISPMVSTLFTSKLPYSTRLEFGEPTTTIPFYVLPVSPAAFNDINKTQKYILEKLYRRMEQLVTIDPESLHTQKKFLALKSLYNEQLGPQKNLSLHELLVSIQSWKKANKDILSPLRKKYFWDDYITRQSASSKLLDEIEQNLYIELTPS